MSVHVGGWGPRLSVEGCNVWQVHLAGSSLCVPIFAGFAAAPEHATGHQDCGVRSALISSRYVASSFWVTRCFDGGVAVPVTP